MLLEKIIGPFFLHFFKPASSLSLEYYSSKEEEETSLKHIIIIIES